MRSSIKCVLTMRNDSLSALVTSGTDIFALRLWRADFVIPILGRLRSWAPLSNLCLRDSRSLIALTLSYELASSSAILTIVMITPSLNSNITIQFQSPFHSWPPRPAFLPLFRSFPSRCYRRALAMAIYYYEHT